MHDAVLTNNCQCGPEISSSSSIYSYSTFYHSVHLANTQDIYMRDFPPPKSVRLEQNISAKTGPLCKFRSPS